MATESIQLWVCPRCREIADPYDDNVVMHTDDCLREPYVKLELVTFIPARNAE